MPFDSHADFMRAGRGEYDGITYGTDRLPQQRVLEEALRVLENAALTRVFPSGISASKPSPRTRVDSDPAGKTPRR